VLQVIHCVLQVVARKGVEVARHDTFLSLTSTFGVVRVGPLLQERGSEVAGLEMRVQGSSDGSRRGLRIRPELPAHLPDTGRAHRKGQREPSPRERSTAMGAAQTDKRSGRPTEHIGELVKYLRRDLKVCEACGGLWVRTGVEAGVYCRSCSAQMADLPGRRRRSPGRPCKVHGQSGSEGRLRVVQAAEELPEPAPRGRCLRRAASVQDEMVAVERRAAMALVGGGR